MRGVWPQQRDAALADDPALDDPVRAWLAPLQRASPLDGRNPLARLVAPGGGAVDIGAFEMRAIGIGRAAQCRMQRGQPREFRFRERALGDGEEVYVAGGWVEVAQRQRAAQVDADEVRAQRLAHARQQMVSSAATSGGSGWRGVYEQVCPHFTEEELVNLTLVIVTINGWNRFAISFRSEPGKYKPRPRD